MSDLSGVQKYFKDKKFSPLQEFQLNKIPVTISLTLNYFNQLSNNESFEIIKTPPQAFTEDPENYMMSDIYSNLHGQAKSLSKTKLNLK